METSGDVTDAGQTNNEQQGKTELLSFWSVKRWVSQLKDNWDELGDDKHKYNDDNEDICEVNCKYNNDKDVIT